MILQDSEALDLTSLQQQQQQQRPQQVTLTSAPTDTIIVALRVPAADVTRPQTINLTSALNSSSTRPESPLTAAASSSTASLMSSSHLSTMATTPVSSTILDLHNLIAAGSASNDLHEEPLDLSTPTSRENLDLATSLQGLSQASTVPITTAPDDVVMRAPAAPAEDAGATVIDPELAYAALTAVTSNSITPLVKEELRCTIQQKRLSEGKDELQVQFEEPAPCKLTKEEEQKRQRRRERNRVAAQKCRNKRKEKADVLQAETKDLEDKNQLLREEIEKLEQEKERLRHMLVTHDILPTKCNMKLSVSEDDSFSTATSVTEAKEDMEDMDLLEDMDDSSDEGHCDLLDQVL